MGYKRKSKQKYKTIRKALRNQHDAVGFNVCSESCPGCKAEQDELDRLGDPPPPNLDCFPRGAHHYDRERP